MKPGTNAPAYFPPDACVGTPQRGFTLIELVVVMVVLAIIAATAAMRLGGSNGRLGPQADQLVSDIRYVQSLSMTRNARHCIAFTAVNYTITNSNCTTPIALLTAANPVVLASGVTLATTNNLLTFNTLGRPFTDAAATTALAAEAVLTLTAGSDSLTVRVTPETGRVRVQ
jgi:prepilin-type N-terminal cleavage/methylation domain-containing protein